MARRRRGAAAVIRSNQARSGGGMGSRKPRTQTQRSDAAAAQRVGGYAGATFDNKNVGRPQ